MAYKVGTTIVIDDQGFVPWSRISGAPAAGLVPGEYTQTAAEYKIVGSGNIVSTTKVNDYNVTVTLNSPQADLRELMYASGRFIMRSPGQLTESKKCAKTLIGTGPFKQKSVKT